MLNVIEYLSERKALVDAALNETLSGVEDAPPGLLDAMRYSALDGGKRIRPILVLASAEAVGGDTNDAMPAACAIELIHTFSLIHDDLPCMDDDDLRRGKPTSHKAFGEAIAVLAGDALLTFAFEALVRAHSDAAVVLACVREIAGATGPRGMIGGQTLDMEFSGREATLEDVQSIHRKKTGALLRASVVVGGLIGGGRGDQIDALGEYGEALGLAFQITDDILDAVGDSSKTGKTGGKDERDAKATYPRLVGLDRARDMAAEAVERAVEAISRFDSRADALRLIAQHVAQRDA